MSLIVCPQNGCENEVAPTANTCPSCGFNLSQYFSEDLQGYDANPKVRLLKHWVNNGDGTITNKKSGQTWTRAPYGVQWNGDFFSGSPVKLDWHEASERFGRGTMIGLTNNHLDQNKLSQEGRFECGYKNGSERPLIAGSSSWRLPTIADYFTLNELMDQAEGFGSDPNIYYRIFDVIFLRGSQFLVDCTRSEGRFHSATFRTPEQRLLWKRVSYGLTWAYDSYYQTGIDVNSDDKMQFLLVRDN